MRRSVLRSQLGKVPGFGCRFVFTLREFVWGNFRGLRPPFLVFIFASALPVKRHDLLNLHMISLPGSGVILIKAFITVYDLILCRRHFLRGLIRAGVETPVFPMHWCLEAQSGPVSIQDSSSCLINFLVGLSRCASSPGEAGKGERGGKAEPEVRLSLLLSHGRVCTCSYCLIKGLISCPPLQLT